jgi:hypothetical protein
LDGAGGAAGRSRLEPGFSAAKSAAAAAFREHQPRLTINAATPIFASMTQELTMVALRKPDPRPVRRARPTGEKFDPAAAHQQAKELYPTVMAKLAE